MPTPRPSTVRLLLLDADAVIQRMPDTWRDDALAHLAAGWGASAEDLAADTALWGRTRAVLDEMRDALLVFPFIRTSGEDLQMRFEAAGRRRVRQDDVL